MVANLAPNNDFFDKYLYRRREHYRSLFMRNFYGMNEDDFEDVFQDFAFNVFNRFGKYDQSRRLQSWLHKVFINTGYDYARRKIRKEHTNNDGVYSDEDDLETGSLIELLSIKGGESPVDYAIKSERATDIRKRIDQLPEHIKKTLILVYFQGLKYREAAEFLGIQIGAVKNRLRTALGRLELNVSKVTPAYPMRNVA